MTVKCSHVGHEPEVIEDSSEGVPDEDPRGDAAEDGAHDLRARVSCWKINLWYLEHNAVNLKSKNLPMPDLGSLLLVVVEVRDHAHAGDRDAGRGHSLEAARHHQPREGAHRGKHWNESDIVNILDFVHLKLKLNIK